MPGKKKPILLHVSRACIEREKANVILRTQRRIALLRANANSKDYDTDDKPVPVPDNWHCCLNTICFCMLLVLVNLFFLQWLYYNSHNINLKQL
jgi:hypothetical protein